MPIIWTVSIPFIPNWQPAQLKACMCSLTASIHVAASKRDATWWHASSSSSFFSSSFMALPSVVKIPKVCSYLGRLLVDLFCLHWIDNVLLFLMAHIGASQPRFGVHPDRYCNRSTDTRPTMLLVLPSTPFVPRHHHFQFLFSWSRRHTNRRFRRGDFDPWAFQLDRAASSSSSRTVLNMLNPWHARLACSLRICSMDRRTLSSSLAIFSHCYSSTLCMHAWKRGLAGKFGEKAGQVCYIPM